MKARKEQNLLYVTSDLTGAEKPFRRIHSVVAWGDAKATDASARAHAMLTAGEMQNGWICVLDEFQGNMDGLLKTAVATKDDLLVEYFHAPPEPPGLLQELYDVDGLTRYRVRFVNRWNQPVYEVSDPLKKWKTFRDYDVQTTVLEYQDRFLDDFESCRIIVDRLTKQKKVYWLPHLLHGAEKSKNQKEAPDLPIFRAWVYAVWILWETSEKRRSGRPSTQGPESWSWGEEFVNQ